MSFFCFKSSEATEKVEGKFPSKQASQNFQFWGLSRQTRCLPTIFFKVQSILKLEKIKGNRKKLFLSSDKWVHLSLLAKPEIKKLQIDLRIQIDL